MTKDEFNKIKSKPFRPTKYERDYFDEWNIRDFRNRYKGRESDKEFADYFNGDIRPYTDKEGTRFMQCVVYFHALSDEEIEPLLPYVMFFEFNKDFSKLTKDTLPKFREISKYYNSLPYEFWNGIFSFKSDAEPYQQISSTQNGKKYCETLIEIYPTIKNFIDKWPGYESILYRLARRIGPNAYEGILYDDLNNN